MNHTIHICILYKLYRIIELDVLCACIIKCLYIGLLFIFEHWLESNKLLDLFSHKFLEPLVWAQKNSHVHGFVLSLSLSIQNLDPTHFSTSSLIIWSPYPSNSQIPHFVFCSLLLPSFFFSSFFSNLWDHESNHNTKGTF